MRRILMVALTMLVALRVDAQPTPPQPAGAGQDPMSRFFFAPELVMSNQSSIGLSDAQKAAMRKEIQQAQATFTEIQWRVSDEAEKLGALLAPATVDEAAVLEAMNKVVGYEAEIKRAQMRLMIRIKNGLTAAQQAKLNEIRGRRE